MDNYILGLGEDGFDLFVMIFMGLWQAGFALGGLVCLAIGLLILVDFFSWRSSKHKYVTEAEIIGLRVGGMTIDKDQDGESQAISDEAEINTRLKQVAEDLAAKREAKPEGFFSKVFGNFIGLIFIVMIFCVPVAFISFGAYQMIDYHKVQNIGYRTQGEVVDHKRYSNTSGTSSYAAIFRFRDQNGTIWQEPERVSHNRLKFQTGTQKTLIYNPNKPQNFYVDDYWYNMTGPTLFLIIGGFVLFLLAGGGNKMAERFQRERAHTSAPQKKRNQANYQGEIYYEALEYVTKDGARIQTTTDSGSSSLNNRMPGTRVTVVVDERDPYKIRRRTMMWFWLGLIVFVLPGIGFLYLAFHKGISPLFLLIVAYFALSKGGKLVKIWADWQALSADEKAEKKEQFAIRRADRKDAHNNKPLLDKYAVRDRLRVYQAQCRLSGLFMFMISSALLATSYYFYPEFYQILISTPQEVLNLNLDKLNQNQGMALILGGIGSLFMLLSLHSFKVARGR